MFNTKQSDLRSFGLLPDSTSEEAKSENCALDNTEKFDSDQESLLKSNLASYHDVGQDKIHLGRKKVIIHPGWRKPSEEVDGIVVTIHFPRATISYDLACSIREIIENFFQPENIKNTALDPENSEKKNDYLQKQYEKAITGVIQKELLKYFGSETVRVLSLVSISEVSIKPSSSSPNGSEITLTKDDGKNIFYFFGSTISEIFRCLVNDSEQAKEEHLQDHLNAYRLLKIRRFFEATLKDEGFQKVELERTGRFIKINIKHMVYSCDKSIADIYTCLNNEIPGECESLSQNQREACHANMLKYSIVEAFKFSQLMLDQKAPAKSFLSLFFTSKEKRSEHDCAHQLSSICEHSKDFTAIRQALREWAETSPDTKKNCFLKCLMEDLNEHECDAVLPSDIRKKIVSIFPDLRRRVYDIKPETRQKFIDWLKSVPAATSSMVAGPR